MTRRALVVTTINAPTKAVRELAAGAAERGIPFVVAGDTKSPPDFRQPGATYLDVDAQVRAFPELCAVLPTKHYVRKNVAYLAAIRDGAEAVQETDDDNLPRDAFWDDVPDRVAAEAVRGAGPWFNVYALFSTAHIWPRGLPLQFVRDSGRVAASRPAESRGLILQGLADDNPDVDAVYRLVCPLPVTFDRHGPVLLEPGAWCPFNSQNTVYKRAAFPLLYLPAKCSFRMTDIWRSFVAQRCLWEMNEGVVFHQATVYQERNEHDLLKDFEQEVPGYLLNDKIRTLLDAVRLGGGDDVAGNLVRCYEALIAGGVLPADEMPIVRAWCDELSRLDR